MSSLMLSSSKQSKVLRKKIDSLQSKVSKLSAQGVGRVGGGQTALNDIVDDEGLEDVIEEEEVSEIEDLPAEREEIIDDNSQAGYGAAQVQTIEVIKEVPVLIEKEVTIPVKIFVPGTSPAPQNLDSRVAETNDEEPNNVSYKF